MTDRDKFEQKLRPVVANVFGLGEDEVKGESVLGQWVDDDLDCTEIQMDIEPALRAPHLFAEMEEATDLRVMTLRDLTDYVVAHRRTSMAPGDEETEEVEKTEEAPS